MKRLLLVPLFAACGLPPQPELVTDKTEVATPALRPDTRVAQQVPELSPILQVKVAPRSGEVQRVLRDQTTRIALELDATTVFCSEFGYGASFLKVSIPDLDWLAHFDHRVQGTDLPCAAAGACTADLNPDTILQSNPGVDQVDVRVVLTEHLALDAAAHTCTRQLDEQVTATVRGVPLRHHAEDQPTPVKYEVCVALARP